MTRKALEAFKPEKLQKGRREAFEVRNRETGYGEWHYFYRDQDGELFTIVAHRLDTCDDARKDWQKNKNKSTPMEEQRVINGNK